MRVILATGSPLSISQGYGTERVVTGLVKKLSRLGIDIHVVGHAASGEKKIDYDKTLDGAEVHVLPPVGAQNRESYFSMCSQEAPEFKNLVRKLKPDILQVHGIGVSGINIRHLKIAKEAGCRTLLWHNVPGITCMQKALVRDGIAPCDGEIRIHRCTQCRLRSWSLTPDWLAPVVSRVGLGGLSRYFPHRLESLFGARRFTGLHKEGVRALFDTLDGVRVGAQWARDVVSVNGMPVDRIHLIRPGVDLEGVDSTAGDEQRIWKEHGMDRPVRLVYWGRVEAIKGVHTIIDALRARPEMRVELAIVGDVNANDAYVQEVRCRAGEDNRITLVQKLPAARIVPMIHTADVALIPSWWFETGPLTVFEARAAGLPIIGADRGGVSELCKGDSSCRLFPPEDAETLADLLNGIVNNREMLYKMRRDVQPARTMDDVTKEVMEIYTKLLNKHDP